MKFLLTGPNFDVDGWGESTIYVEELEILGFFELIEPFLWRCIWWLLGLVFSICSTAVDTFVTGGVWYHLEGGFRKAIDRGLQWLLGRCAVDYGSVWKFMVVFVGLDEKEEFPTNWRSSLRSPVPLLPRLVSLSSTPPSVVLCLGISQSPWSPVRCPSCKIRIPVKPYLHQATGSVPPCKSLSFAPAKLTKTHVEGWTCEGEL